MDTVLGQAGQILRGLQGKIDTSLPLCYYRYLLELSLTVEIYHAWVSIFCAMAHRQLLSFPYMLL